MFVEHDALYNPPFSSPPWSPSKVEGIREGKEGRVREGKSRRSGARQTGDLPTGRGGGKGTKVVDLAKTGRRSTVR
jgi:hypothetical protein